MRLLCALGLFLALLHVTSCLLIGAFNIQWFRPGKFDKPEAIDIITKIVQRYDIILIQEVLCNHDLSVPDRLKDLVNQDSPPHFSYIVSDPLPLGPRGYRERYLFLYRDETVSVTGCFQYNEGKAGVFDRPPFVVKFSSRQTAVEFVLIPIHTKPDHAVKEIDALVDVVAAAKLKWTNNNIMVLGDFNAGTRYVGDKKRNNKSDWDDIRLFTNKEFYWLIKDNVTTTLAKHSEQAHDRIVVSDDMYQGVVKDSAKVFDFIKAYNPKEALAVSNHFPVEVELELKPKPSVNLKKRRRSQIKTSRLNPN